MAWLLLAAAIASEVVATTALKFSDGLSHKGWSALMIVGYIASFVLLAKALKLQMPLGVAYAVWSGVGTAVIALIGMAFMGESMNLAKMGGILLIIGGVVLLNLSGAH
ncbi:MULTISPECIES: DMT family transporter [Microtetraspora]|uniref:Multidrug efflux SMR transporter n=1 Tax=Microtetraspora glauca TaxID=1996 RepID=A0ABV3GL08_MICGL|nr:multidrug efflux SMR transporter [Microtetraspora sp. AC03309]MCC5576226.1 multidrug efflux SMR transporter [Microtetraspora sp. AC03309]